MSTKGSKLLQCHSCAYVAPEINFNYGSYSQETKQFNQTCPECGSDLIENNPDLQDASQETVEKINESAKRSQRREERKHTTFDGLKDW